MRYWTIVLALLAGVAAILPVTRTVHSIVGDAQIVFALALVALLARLIWQASVQTAVVPAGLEMPAPKDVPAPD